MLSQRRMPTINVEEMMELENLYLVAITAIADSIIMDSVRNYQWKFNVCASSMSEQIPTQCQSISQKKLIKKDQHHLKHVFKVYTTGNGTSAHDDNV